MRHKYHAGTTTAILKLQSAQAKSLTLQLLLQTFPGWLKLPQVGVESAHPPAEQAGCQAFAQGPSSMDPCTNQPFSLSLSHRFLQLVSWAFNELLHQLLRRSRYRIQGMKCLAQDVRCKGSSTCQYTEQLKVSRQQMMHPHLTQFIFCNSYQFMISFPA